LAFLNDDDEPAIPPRFSTVAAGTSSGTPPAVETDSSLGGQGDPASLPSPATGGLTGPAGSSGTASTSTSAGHGGAGPAGHGTAGSPMSDPAAPVDTLSQVAASRAGRAVAQPIVPIVNDHGMRTRGKSGFTQPVDRLNLHAGVLSPVRLSGLPSLIHSGGLPCRPSSTHSRPTAHGIWFLVHQESTSLRVNGFSDTNF
jgi:hypothetical protein